MISRFPRPRAPEVPGFVCSNECPGVVSSWGVRRSRPGPHPSPQLLGSEDSICRGCVVPLQTEPATPGRVPAAPSSRISGKEVPGRWKGGKIWQEMARAATQTRALPLPQVPGLRTTSYVLELCLAGSGAREQPDSARPPCVASLGWEVPVLQAPPLLLSSAVVHSAKQGPDVRSLSPGPERHWGSQGACGCRERKPDSAAFPAPSPPPRPATPPSFPARVTPPGASGKFL